ncbi:MAG: flagellar biosynthesis protein FlgN [Pseudomonadota bacterium]|jgi:flagellar biosynthesis/type III secretory pathway chaperone|nr:flagellar biosynthesis protein FlgN [Pseudomonadota bacterium]
MSDQTALIARLQEIVAEETAAMRGVLEILGRESAALLARDVGSLPGISNSKADAVARAASLGQQRQALLQRDPDQAGITAALAQLRQLAIECRQLNEANGLMIRSQRRRIEGALGILRGGQPGVNVYGRDGAAMQLRQLSRGPLAAW